MERTVLIECLSEYQLDVDEAFYGIQRRNLSELYKYLGSSKDMMDSDGKKGDEKGKSDMDAMKQRVLEKTKEKEKEAYEVRNGYIQLYMVTTYQSLTGSHRSSYTCI